MRVPKPLRFLCAVIVGIIPVVALLTLDALSTFQLFKPRVPQANVNATLVVVFVMMLGVGLAALVYWALGRRDEPDEDTPELPTSK